MSKSFLLNMASYAAGALAVALIFAVFYPIITGKQSDVSYLDALLYVIVGRVAVLDAAQ